MQAIRSNTSSLVNLCLYIPSTTLYKAHLVTSVENSRSNTPLSKFREVSWSIKGQRFVKRTRSSKQVLAPSSLIPGPLEGRVSSHAAHLPQLDPYIRFYPTILGEVNYLSIYTFHYTNFSTYT